MRTNVLIHDSVRDINIHTLLPTKVHKDHMLTFNTCLFV